MMLAMAAQARHVEETEDVGCWERGWDEALRKPFS